MSTFKKYLQIINENNADYSDTNDTPGEIIALNNKNLQGITGKVSNITVPGMELDEAGKKLIKKMVQSFADEIIDHPKKKVVNERSRFTFPNLLNADKFSGEEDENNVKKLGKNLIKKDDDITNYNKLLVLKLAEALIEMIYENELQGLFQKLTKNEIGIRVDNTDMSIININKGYTWYSIDLDIEGIERRPWEGRKGLSVKRHIVPPTPQQNAKWYSDINYNIQQSLRNANQDARERTKAIEKINRQQNPPINMGKKANREKYGR